MKTDRIDELLKQAVLEFHTRELEQIPDNLSLKRIYEPLSDIFYARIKQIIYKLKCQQRKIKMLQNVAAAIFVVILLSLLSNPGVITRATDAIIKWFDNFVQIHYEDDNNLEELKEYGFGYVPDGFEFKDKWYDDTFYTPAMGTLDYSCGKEYLNLFYAKNGNTQNVSAENSTLEIVKRNGVQIHCMQVIDEDRLYLVWEKDGITFTMMTSLDKEEALKVQESVYAIEPERPTEYEIKSMPEGYIIYHSKVDRKGGEIKYGSKDDILELTYEQSIIELYVDENDTNLRIIRKDDTEIYYFEYQNEEKHKLMWYENGFIFTMTSNLDKEELLKIQDSVQLKVSFRDLKLDSEKLIKPEKAAE